MMKELIRASKALPNCFLVAIGLLLCLSSDAAFAAQKRKPATDCSSASNKNKPPCAVESPTGQITVFWPKLRMTNAVARVFDGKMEVWIDKTLAGVVVGEEPLALTLPNGPHKLELKPYDDYLENIRPIKATEITVSAQKPLYFQILDQGFSINASELDAATAQTVLAGGDAPKTESNANATPSLMSFFSSESKAKSDSAPSQAGPAGNAASGPLAATASLNLYWPRPALGLGFLDKYSSDIPVYLDEKRVGAIKLGEYVSLKVPTGEHTLGLDVGLGGGRLLKQDFLVGANETRHFHMQNQDTYRLLEDSPEDAAGYAKGLNQRQAAAQ
jgi:hypothetical protein